MSYQKLKLNILCPNCNCFNVVEDQKLVYELMKADMPFLECGKCQVIIKLNQPTGYKIYKRGFTN